MGSANQMPLLKGPPPGALQPGGPGVAGPGHSLPPPREQGQSGQGGVPGQGLGRGGLGPPVPSMMQGGPGLSQPVLPPGLRRPLDDDYGRGSGPMGPNGQTVEPAPKRPR